ncbi:hypothetical protein [Demequina lutea]|uniref:Uncharacterized protein n=1 Tax=Demequina lutea TaxID=431489 RepID=A0A7Z0CIE0_9MICO|nr:hypothetical protein [Demequina lutea]NYI42466.1 hypothetical protein [Demequina lutea]
MTFQPEHEPSGDERSRAEASAGDPSNGGDGTAGDGDTSRRPPESPAQDFAAVPGPDDEAPMWLVASLERGEPLAPPPQPRQPTQGTTPSSAGWPVHEPSAAWPPQPSRDAEYSRAAQASFPAGPDWIEPVSGAGAHKARRRISQIVVLVLVLAVAVVGGRLAFGALTATPDDYTAPLISPQDVATEGGLMWISQTGKAALEVDPTWTNESSVESGDVSGLFSHEVTVYASTWTLPGGAGTVRMFEAADPEASNQTLTAIHESAVSSASKLVMKDMGDVVQVAPTIPHGVTTSTGLHGRVSDLAWNASGKHGTVTVYTFMHHGRVVIVQVTVVGDTGTQPSVGRAVSTLRIDK